MKTLLIAALTGVSMLAMNSALAVERGGTMTFARYDDSNLVDPVYADRNPDIWMVTNLYDTLLRTNADGKTIVPGLASGYAVSEDGKTISVTLRDGIKFSDGSAITSHDVQFSLERAMNPDLGPWSGLMGSVGGVSTDGNTVTLTLKNPDPALISILATFNTAIVSKAAFDAAPGATDQEKATALFAPGTPVSGPFSLKDRARGSTMTFSANPHYWRQGEDGKPLPYLDEVSFIVIPDDATRILKLQAGEVNGAEFVPFSRVAELTADPAINMELYPSTRIVYSPINTRQTRADGSANPLANKGVRQALNYATNKDALVQLITHGTGKAMTSPLMASTTQLAHDGGPLYPYDMAKAKELAAAAGLKEGTEITLTTLAGSSDDSTLFAALQQMWTPLGVSLKVEQVDGPTRGAKNRSGEFDIHTYGWVNDVNDPAQVAGWLGYYPTRKAVGTGWNNAEFNTLFEASNTEIDPEKRSEQYKSMQDIYADAAPLLFLYETPFAVALSSNVNGYLQTPLGNNEFSSAWIAK
ncbi:ABC transporter substrate-binding protein [Pseudovibrio sp. Tun.PSC04-5.I4]|uniref:ABC transporter substrate-binding protein n=1 Tax=Pseudovibrio sp. Tun.PSC04-5.I4 TaxID=1798213 RepID=UPI00088BA42E|nr:ABC transporter substrate-binding protein [Pseudovibrio sp. Tun.PSC04-5.I4]SDQ23530.1 peptide/nickel transport system substrate-binding protein [Pseudovibrio sp. Tun.PSC04-5.I4]